MAEINKARKAMQPLLENADTSLTESATDRAEIKKLSGMKGHKRQNTRTEIEPITSPTGGLTFGALKNSC